jgi:lysophospholipase L1-like esterase
MDEAHSYPRQLERILNERLLRQGATGRVEVINAGVVGYSTAQEAAYFRLWGHRYQPDLVLLAFYPVNDTEDKLSRYARYHRLRSINPWLLEIYTSPRNLYLRQFWKGMRRKLKQEVAAARLSVAQRLGRTDRGAEAIVEEDWTYRFDSEYEGWGLARRGLREIGETAREIGAEGLVVLLPDLLDIARYEDRYHPRIAPLLRAEVQTAGLDWLDLVEVFQPFRDREEAVRMKLRRHPNAEGYRLIAEAVAASVERRYRPVGLGGSGG